jgi:hypothetical protein
MKKLHIVGTSVLVVAVGLSAVHLTHKSQANASAKSAVTVSPSVTPTPTVTPTATPVFKSSKY